MFVREVSHGLEYQADEIPGIVRTLHSALEQLTAKNVFTISFLLVLRTQLAR